MGFQITGAAVLLAFYGCYFAKMISQRQKGIVTDQLGKDKAGTERRIETATRFVTYLVPAAEAVSIALNTAPFPCAVRAAGAAAAAAGTAAFAISAWTMRDSWRAGVPRTDRTELVTDGIYQFSRNPAFLGFDLVYIGIAVMFFNWILFAVSAAAIAVLHLQIVAVEEKFLSGAFGDAYIGYQKRVRRYLGRKR